MNRLIQEADADDRFNSQLKKVQSAILVLDELIAEMKRPGSLKQPTRTQVTQLKHAAEDLKKLYDKAQ